MDEGANSKKRNLLQLFFMNSKLDESIMLFSKWERFFLQNKLLVFCVGHLAMQATPVILEDAQICFSEKVCFVGQINTEKMQAIFHDKKDPAN